MKIDEHTACILLGSNIEPEANIPQAVCLLREKVSVLRVSSAWESASVECCYPDYINLAVLVKTSLYAEELKQQVLRPLEARMGRIRTEDINAPRPIDFDIILFDGVLMDPNLWEHVHRAMPVSELFPDYPSNGGETLLQVARRQAGITPIRQREDVAVTLPESGC